MAIDSSLFVGKIPAAAYAVGDRITMGISRGPSIVRDGYGAAVLKRIVTVANTSAATFIVKVKNSNWVDGLSNFAYGGTETLFGNNAGAVQSGNDAPLVPNSGWEVVAECVQAGTETADADIAALIDVDYPKVTAVLNPRDVTGLPVTIDGTYSHTVAAKGSLDSGVWATYNIDPLKAGYKYLLTEASFKDSLASSFGFLSISGAANQAGLERIIPVRSGSVNGLRYSLDYSTPLVKGPMNLNILSVGTAGTSSAYVYLDFVKKNI